MKETIDSGLLLLGKIYFLLTIIGGIYSEGISGEETLLVFIFHSWIIFDYVYIYKECLMFVKGKSIFLKEIIEFKVERRFIDQVYLYITTKEEEKLHFCLSQREYEELSSYAK